MPATSPAPVAGPLLEVEAKDPSHAVFTGAGPQRCAEKRRAMWEGLVETGRCPFTCIGDWWFLIYNCKGLILRHCFLRWESNFS